MATFEKLVRYFGVVMPFCYVIFGGYILGKYKDFFYLRPAYSITLGCVLIVYGLFRCYRAFQATQKEKQ